MEIDREKWGRRVFIGMSIFAALAILASPVGRVLILLLVVGGTLVLTLGWVGDVIYQAHKEYC
jgi:type III secretory pathway component EscS